MKTKLPAIIFLSVLFIILEIIYSACSCKSCSEKNIVLQVPESIFSKTDGYIQSKTGNTFFAEFIHADYIGSMKKNGKYEVKYNFRMLAFDFVDEEITIITDSLGNIINESGIPNCMLRDEGCRFSIDRERAIEIGHKNNLPDGVKKWAVEFRWSSDVDQYIWHIIVTKSEFGSNENYKAEGEELMIDPVNGEVIKHRAWSIR